MAEAGPRSWLPVLALVALGLTAGKKDGLDDVFAPFADVSTAQGRFVQTKNLAAFKKVQKQKGYFKSGSDGRVLYVVTEPVKSVFAVKDGKVLVRYPDLDWEEITDLEASPTLGAVVKSILAVLGTTSADAVRKAYKAKIKKEGKDGWTLILKPRDETVAKAIDRIVMRVHTDARVSRVEIHEKSGDSTYIEFDDVTLNEPIEDPLFDF
ncbi:MAG: outer membrane lipoprotein carrier protein LolA [Deltaproteobacteria bacterium]|nr:outer membrane lipoprotein carrier protein LolA [Deltaproteobacteria bacterium]